MNEIWIQVIGWVGALGLFISLLGWQWVDADYEAKKKRGWAIACLCFAVLCGTYLGISSCLLWEGSHMQERWILPMVAIGVTLVFFLLVKAVVAYKEGNAKKQNLCVFGMGGVLVLYIVFTVVFQWPFF